MSIADCKLVICVAQSFGGAKDSSGLLIVDSMLAEQGFAVEVLDGEGQILLPRSQGWPIFPQAGNSVNGTPAFS